MNGGNTSWINEFAGYAHTGSGDQNINITYMATAGGTEADRTPNHWTTGTLLWLKHRFEHPPGFSDAQHTIEEQKAVLLVGRPGCGRVAAALMLLVGDRSVSDVRIRVLAPKAESRDDGSWTSNPVSRGEGLLLDLTAVADEDYSRICADIIGFLGVLHRQGARLAIVDGHRGGLQTDLEQLRADIDRPNARAAFWRYIRAEDMWSKGLALDAEQTEYLATMPLRGIPRIITLLKSGLREAPEATTASCIAAAFRTLVKGDADFKILVGQVSDAPRRALLLTAALHNGLPVDAVYFAYRDLAAKLRHAGDELPILARAGFVEQLEDCRVVVGTDAARRIRFKDLEDDSRAREYFWNEFPELRGTLLGWICWSAKRSDLSVHDRARLVVRFAAESLRTNRQKDIISLATKLGAQSGPAGGFRLLIYQLLQSGLDSEYHGSYFRRYLYDRAVEYRRKANAHPTASYASILVELCANHVAQNHPDQAIVRLHHFCADDGPVGDQAFSALLDLARRDEGALLLLIRRIVEGSIHAPHRDAELFVAALALDRPAENSVLRIPHDSLVAGWRLVIGTDTTTNLAGHLNVWLESCLPPSRLEGTLATRRSSEAVLRILALAASNTFAQQSRLEKAAGLWAAADIGNPTPRWAVVARLAHWIDRAAGASSGDFPFGPLAWKAA